MLSQLVVASFLKIRSQPLWNKTKSPASKSMGFRCANFVYFTERRDGVRYKSGLYTDHSNLIICRFWYLAECRLRQETQRSEFYTNHFLSLFIILLWNLRHERTEGGKQIAIAMVDVLFVLFRILWSDHLFFYQIICFFIIFNVTETNNLFFFFLIFLTDLTFTPSPPKRTNAVKKNSFVEAP